MKSPFQEPSFRETPPGLAAAFLALCALFLLLMMLGANALWGDESRYAEAARLMVRGEDFLKIPAMARNLPCHPLPVLWPLAAMLSLDRSEFLLRLPSVAAALLTIFGTVSIGRRFGGRGVGMTAGYLLLGSYGILFWGRMASPAVWTTCWMVLGCWLFLRKGGLRGSFCGLFGFYGCFVLAGFCGTMAAASGMLFFAAAALTRKRKWRNLLRFRHLAALAAAFGLSLLPGLWGHEGELVFGIRELANLAAAIPFFPPGGGTAAHAGAPPINLGRAFLPWTLLGIGAVVAAGLHWEKQRFLTRISLAALAATLMLLSVFTVRRWQYPAVLLPFTALLTAMVYCGENRRNMLLECSLKLTRMAAVAVASLGVVSIILLPFWEKLVHFRPPWIFLAALPVFGAAALAVLLAEEQSKKPFPPWLTGMPRHLAGTILAGTILSGGLFCAAIPAWQELRTGKEFLLRLHAEGASIPPERVIFWGGEVPAFFSFYWNAPKVPVHADSTQKLREILNAGGAGRFVIAVNNRPGELASLAKAAEALNLNIDLSAPARAEKRQLLERPDEPKMLAWIMEIGEKKEK